MRAWQEGDAKVLRKESCSRDKELGCRKDKCHSPKNGACQRDAIATPRGRRFTKIEKTRWPGKFVSEYYSAADLRSTKFPCSQRRISSMLSTLISTKSC